MPAGVGDWDSSESGDWKIGGEDLCDHWRWSWGSGVSAVVCYGTRAEPGDWIWRRGAGPKICS